jgi:choline dehydrogenase
LIDAAEVASDDALTRYIRDTAVTFKHPACTLRMGPEGDPHAVVDQYGQVRGVDRLHVADASIMPNIPRANTNLTCIMIGERMADLMRRDDSRREATGVSKRDR